MKKENKKLAQEQRAAQRKKEARKNLIKSIFTVGIPALAVVALVVLIIWDPFSKVTGNSLFTGSDTESTSSNGTSNDTTNNKTESSEGTYTPKALDEKLTYYADIKLKDYGTITVKLDQKSAPISAANFVALAEDGFYDGLTFHRIMAGFMMQGGDPNGNGTGGSDQTITGEFAANGIENNLSHTRGAISMARAQAYNSASSQFFIVHEDSTFLDGNYAAFGYVTEGMEVVDNICEDAEPTDNNGSIAKEAQPVIQTITIRK